MFVQWRGSQQVWKNKYFKYEGIWREERFKKGLNLGKWNRGIEYEGLKGRKYLKK